MRAGWVPSLALLSMLWSSPEFEGCGAGPDVPAPPRPLPVAAAACTFDADCETDPCEVATCVTGRCIASPRPDVDLDGERIPPCGNDCDDSRADAHPGGVERCNARDEDCDSIADEGAPALDAVVDTTSGPFSTGHFGAGVLLPAPDGPLLFHNGLLRNEASLARVTPDGVLAGGRSLMPFGLSRGLSAVQRRDGSYVVALYDEFTEWATFRRAGDGTLAFIDSPSRVLDSRDRGNVALVAIGDEYAVAYDRGTRFVRFGFLGPFVEVAPETSDGNDLRIATDGTHAVVPDPNDDELVFIRADGTIAARVPHAPAHRPRALASGVGVVYLETLDGDEAVLSTITATGATTLVPLPTSGRHALVGVDRLLVVATLLDPPMWSVSVVDPSTGEPLRGPIAMEGSTAPWFAVRAYGGIAVSAGGVQVGFLGACGTLPQPTP